MKYYTVLVIRLDGEIYVSLFAGENQFGVHYQAKQAAIEYLLNEDHDLDEDHGQDIKEMTPPKAFEALQDWLRETEDGEMEIYEVDGNL